MSTPAPPAPGGPVDLGGRYRLDRLLGSGATADVWAGCDLQLDREVAVKVGRPGVVLAGEEDGVRTEARLTASLYHPNLVTVFDAGLAGPTPYVVMELVRGPDLARHRAGRPGGALPVDEVVQLAVQMSSALARVHRSGLVHRDVKPGNILVDEDQDRRTYCLADFGIARLVGATRRTATGVALGTAPYLAPEQVLGDRVGPPADLYSLGLVLLECLTGRVEYPGTAVEAAVARLHRAPELPGSIPEPLRACLQAVLLPDPADRPEATEVQRRLAPALAGERYRPPVLRPRPRRRGRLVIALAAAAALAALGIAVAQERDGSSRTAPMSSSLVPASRPA